MSLNNRIRIDLRPQNATDWAVQFVFMAALVGMGVFAYEQIQEFNIPGLTR